MPAPTEETLADNGYLLKSKIWDFGEGDNVVAQISKSQDGKQYRCVLLNLPKEIPFLMAEDVAAAIAQGVEWLNTVEL